MIIPRALYPSRELVEQYFQKHERLFLVNTGFKLSIVISKEVQTEIEILKQYFNPEVVEEIKNSKSLEETLQTIRSFNGFSWDGDNCKLGFWVNNFIWHLSEIFNRKNMGVEFMSLEQFLSSDDNSGKQYLIDNLNHFNQSSDPEEAYLYDSDFFFDKL